MADEKNHLPEWCHLLTRWKEDSPPDTVDKLLVELDTNPRTLYRWMRGENRPDSKLKVLTLEKNIPEMAFALRKEFPQYYEYEFQSSQEAVLSAVAPFYVRVAQAARDIEKPFLLHTITRLVISNLVAHVDVEQHGFVALLVQLQSTHNNLYADELRAHAWSNCGTAIWFDFFLQRSFPVYKKSLCELAISTGNAAFYPRDQDYLINSTDILHVDRVQSAAAYPILRKGKVAGVIFMAAATENFFTTYVRSIIEHYLLMIDRAFDDTDFYSLSQITITNPTNELDDYQQFLLDIARDYPDDTPEQFQMRVKQVFQKYHQDTLKFENQ